MKTLTRYVLREFLVPLGYCLTGFVSIYILFELFGSFSRIVDAKLPAVTVVRYFLAYLAPFIVWLAPAALLLATLYTMWNFCRHSEITAMRASGVSFIAIVKPLLAVALGVTLAVTWVNECYVPGHAQWAKQLRNEKFDQSKLALGDNLTYRNASAFRTWTVDGAVDSDGRHLENVKVTTDRENGARIRCVTADSAEWLDGEWWFVNPKVLHYDVAGREIASPVPALDALTCRVFPEFRERPDDILMQNRDWRYNSVRSKLRFIRTHADLEPDKRRDYTYDAWQQIVAPWACLVITLFAIPAGIASGRQSVFRGILGALTMFFCYYGLDVGCMVLAKRGWLPPIPAVLCAPLVFLALGVGLFRRQR